MLKQGVHVEGSHPIPEYSKDDLDKAFSEALAAAERIHSKLASATEDAGYIKKALYSTKPVLDGLYARAQDDPSAYPLIASGVDFLRGLGPQLDRFADMTDEFTTPFGLAINSTGTFSTTSASASMLWNIDYIQDSPIPAPPDRKSRDHYSARLRNLNKSLAALYEEVWQAYFGTSSDPHRAALFMMRTLFDNFFAHIAPDDQVRASHYWREKEGDKPDQIWRPERLGYALENIEDPGRRSILAALSTQIAALYKAANAAHDRGTLDEERASKALAAMDSFLKDWIDSLE